MNGENLVELQAFQSHPGRVSCTHLEGVDATSQTFASLDELILAGAAFCQAMCNHIRDFLRFISASSMLVCI